MRFEVNQSKLTNWCVWFGPLWSKCLFAGIIEEFWNYVLWFCGIVFSSHWKLIKKRCGSGASSIWRHTWTISIFRFARAKHQSKMVCLNVGFNSWRIVFLNSDSNWNQELTVDPKQNLEKETVMTGQPTPPPNEPPQRRRFCWPKNKGSLLREFPHPQIQRQT